MNTSLMMAIVFVMATGNLSTVSDHSNENRKPQGQAITLPCSSPDYKSDRYFFRATGSASHQNKSTAERMARLDANANLAATINVTMHSVIDRYVSEHHGGEASQTSRRYVELTRSTADQQLRNVGIVCNESTFNNGRFTVYMAVEVPKENVLQSIDKDVSSEPSGLDYEKMKFEKIFDEEMEKLENEKKP
jgi:hypothetical protein